MKKQIQLENTSNNLSKKIEAFYLNKKEIDDRVRNTKDSGATFGLFLLLADVEITIGCCNIYKKYNLLQYVFHTQHTLPSEKKKKTLA